MSHRNKYYTDNYNRVAGDYFHLGSQKRPV